MVGGKTLSTLLPPYVKLSEQDCPKSDDEKAKMAKIPYASVVGSLMYAMIATRPDIAFAVGVVSTTDTWQIQAGNIGKQSKV